MKLLGILLLAGMATQAINTWAGQNPDMDEEQAVKLAIAELESELGAAPDQVKLVHAARFTWPDSSLGCPKPGMQYSQALVTGYLVLMTYDNKQHRVHVGNGRAILCPLDRIPISRDQMVLPQLQKMAREDLASKLGVGPDAIEVVESAGETWPDSRYGCPGATGNARGVPVRGYRLTLEHKGRQYEYRTSQDDVAACPPIELR